jgi:uncharacterized protein YcbX
MIVLSELYLYPVKSLAGIQVTSWELDAFGLRFDRRWMVVTPAGKFMTQREFPQMARIHPRLESGADGEVRLRLWHPELGECKVPAARDRPRVRVIVWHDEVEAVAIDPTVDAWLAQALGVPCRLVFFPQEACRQIDLSYANPGERVAFADGFPLLLIGQGSLDELNRKLVAKGKPKISMRRFRPNLVVAGAEAHAEDGWSQIKIGEVVLRVVKPCSRCVITTVDPERGEFAGKEPLATLATYRLRDNKIYFGQNLIHENLGSLRVGEPVQVLSVRS